MIMIKFSALSYVQAISLTYAALFPVLNPLGGAVTFMTYTLGLPDKDVHSLSWRVAVNTFILLTVVLFTGSWVLHFFGLTVPIVRIGGGLVVGYIGWSLLNQLPNSSAADPQPQRTSEDFHHLAFFPLTMPITAGPGCIAVILTIGTQETKRSIHQFIIQQSSAIIGILLASATIFLCYRFANRLTHRLGHSGTQVIMRLFAFITLCIGLQIIWIGIQDLVS